MFLTFEYLGRAQEKLFFIRKEEKMDIKDVFISVINPTVVIVFGNCVAEVKNGSEGVTLEVYPKEPPKESNEETDSSEKEE